MDKRGGWAGSILRVNVTDLTTSVIPMHPYAEKFIGGVGSASKIAWDEIRPDIGAFEAENRLIFSTGPLTGTPAPGSGRMEIMGKSPRPYPNETVTRSGMGGHWGTELKLAGYDVLILEGAAPEPVYLVIDREGVRFFDADELWGQDTFSTQKMLKEKYGAKTQCVCIGPAGEHKCRIATIMSETSFASGKSGFGAVMGAKKVKAIAVSGKGGHLDIAHPARVLNLASSCRDLLGKNPMREWTTGYPLPDHRKRFFSKYRTGNASCFGCPLQCFAFVKVPGLDPCQVHCVNYYYDEPAYAYYGETLEGDQALWQGNVMCNKLGICTFEMAGMVQWVKDLFDEGLIDEKTSGIPLRTFGSREFIETLLNSIAYRRDLGDTLAEGAARAAGKIRGSWGLYEKYYPAHGQTEHNSVRDFPGIALLWALDSRDPMIDHHAYRQMSVSRLRWPEPHTLTTENAKVISERIFGTRTAIDHSTYAEKARAVAYCQNRSSVIDSLVLCDWLYPAFVCQSREDRMGDTSVESKLLTAVTGLEISEDELNEVGERIWNVERAIMVREGRSRKDDTLHESYFSKAKGAHGVVTDSQGHTNVASDQTSPVPRKALEEAKDEYYKIRGWDVATGVPTQSKLVDLDLKDIGLSLGLPE